MRTERTVRNFHETRKIGNFDEKTLWKVERVQLEEDVKSWREIHEVKLKSHKKLGI